MGLRDERRVRRKSTREQIIEETKKEKGKNDKEKRTYEKVRDEDSNKKHPSLFKGVGGMGGALLNIYLRGDRYGR